MIHKAWSCIEKMPYCFLWSSLKFQGPTGHHCGFWPKLSISGLFIKFEFTDGFEMMHKAWCSREEVPFCFPRSSIKFQGHTGQKIADFDPNWACADCNFSFNSPVDLKLYTKLDLLWRGALLFSKVIHQISRSQGTKNQWFGSNWTKITRPVAAIKSLRFALFMVIH